MGYIYFINTNRYFVKTSPRKNAVEVIHSMIYIPLDVRPKLNYKSIHFPIKVLSIKLKIRWVLAQCLVELLSRAIIATITPF